MAWREVSDLIGVGCMMLAVLALLLVMGEFYAAFPWFEQGF